MGARPSPVRADWLLSLGWKNTRRVQGEIQTRMTMHSAGHVVYWAGRHSRGASKRPARRLAA